MGAYQGQLETVDEIKKEAGTYFRRFADSVELMAGLERMKVHSVTKSQKSAVETRISGTVLDAGERDLWAHAIKRRDTWILCGPDKASLTAAVKLGLRGRLISLEQLLKEAGLSTKGLPEHQTKAWLDRTVSQIVIEQFQL
ncbi:MAG: hypothetical protein U0975_01740 [Erythrobacter sp.]|nr:hypothetical protein [Erythrobacter sp.]MDZ4271372.1 hypothetical protein [Erythrobacter sp.]